MLTGRRNNVTKTENQFLSTKTSERKLNFNSEMSVFSTSVERLLQRTVYVVRACTEASRVGVKMPWKCVITADDDDDDDDIVCTDVSTQRWRLWSRCRHTQKVVSRRLLSSRLNTTRNSQSTPWWRTKPPLYDTKLKVKLISLSYSRLIQFNLNSSFYTENLS